MIALRPAASRGSSHSTGSLIRHSFSFGDYYDPSHMGFGPLRVINEVELAPGASIAAQPRANVEVLNWIVVGSLHDAIADGNALRAGELSCLSAGCGAEDGVANASGETAARVLQVWLQSDRVNAQPCRSRISAAGRGGVSLLASGAGRDGSATIRQDVDVYAVRLRAGQRVSHALCLGRRAWLQSTAGSVAINGVQALVGDGVVVLNESRIELLADSDAELLLFDICA